ncbi:MULTISPECIES: tryptophan 2,3-dioxygenase family protein [Flavobacterium]|uniref:tryptophan 2,3-dioxygenase family protein n=1 Tax=Flavobacterium TaxID=237 RepID=UPI000745CFA2|nr:MULTISPECIES: tryptophan 2,3-dioxygenase family protein [Flavobacterium]OXA81808.1 tryptophan 2,3-dioxygenase [Flavobacterium columnare] [Flavobacterium columnare NBRC 100251 = ATCC 23463]AMA50322.1 tryptophan 2,3-dioxygenase [Flavobacterium covae]AND64137.1 tryptophan 2,3-dioxygenase [Flavobacterium covae]MCJ1806470.1 tryptophan 2,3-dioxygenase family protein [Flavobacterium covae]MCJ1808472.1 tryptophan 2,3-dioxygenase family protein [Flavobacterium covae]
MNDYSNLVDKIDQKYQSLDQKTEAYLEGLLWSKPITYWDYIQTDALLSLQNQRTIFPDENVFIMYHQINELLFKMILWEIKQVSYAQKLTTQFFTDRLMRISRYFDMLTTSFTIMGEGMDVEQYMKFRHTLTPASGFQSAQYRMIEFCSTDLINLIDYRYRTTIDRNTSYNHAFEHLYWQAAGKNYKTGEKSYFLKQFEEKYKKEFLQVMEEYNTINLWCKFKQLPIEDQTNPELIKAMRHYDYTVNITWVMGHYRAAQKYIDNGKGNGEATGGSDWKKYMHPRYQRRIFFPELWSEEELKNWGEEL